MTEILNILFSVDDVNYRYPVFLNGLYFLPVLAGSAIFYIFRNSRLVRILDGKPPVVRNALRATALIIALAFFILAYAEPFGVDNFKIPVRKGEVADFVIDLSLSQNAADIKPNRLEAGKLAILSAADALNADGITMLCLSFFTVSFNRLLECTEDVDNFKSIVKRMDLSMAGNLGGTNLLAAIPTDYELIRQEVIPKNSRLTLFLITDGGKEMERDNHTGVVIEQVPDWKEDELRTKVTALAKSGVRIIPVGVGGKKPAPVKVHGATYYTLLDEAIIKKIAMWSGAPERYFIVSEGSDFGRWISDQILLSREIDHYRDETKEFELWKYFLVAGIFFASLALGAMGFLGKIKDKITKRR